MIDLPDVPLAHYRFRLRLEQATRLPGYLGSTLRGGLGYVLKELVCFERGRQTCDGCLLRGACPYGYLFEPAPPPDAEVLSAESDLPLAFLLEPPLDRRTDCQAGEAIEFGLTLVGRGTGYLPYFILGYRQLGRRGLGRAKTRYVLEEVRAVDPRPGARREAAVYAAGDEQVRDCDLSASWPALAARARAWPPGRLTVDFITPTRLKHGGVYHEQPEFHVLVRALLRRLSSLAYFHGGRRWEADFPAWIARAEAVRTAAAAARWVERERYSTRQRQRTSLGGAVGPMTYQGDLAPFGPLLAVGEWVHAGKACVFGNGRYRIVT